MLDIAELTKLQRIHQDRYDVLRKICKHRAGDGKAKRSEKRF